MSLKHEYFTSNPPEDYYPFFLEHRSIQGALENICEKWVAYLESHIELTGKLFNEPEIPWKHTERAIVSTLSAAISKGFPDSLVIEERDVVKTGNKNGKGRWDLWATIPELKVASEQFSFYLEAKRSQTPKTTDTLLHYLNTDRGVSRIFNDYLKCAGEKIKKLSPYGKLGGRVHPHYVIGLLVMPLERNPKDPSDVRCYPGVDTILHDVFDNWHTIKTKSSSIPEIKRRLGRFPTAALILEPQNGHTGMIAVFTVIGATQELLNKPNA